MDCPRTCALLPMDSASGGAHGDMWLCFTGICKPSHSEPPQGAVDVTSDALLRSARPVLEAQATRLGAHGYAVYMSQRPVSNFMALDAP